MVNPFILINETNGLWDSKSVSKESEEEKHGFSFSAIMESKCINKKKIDEIYFRPNFFFLTKLEYFFFTYLYDE